MGRIIYPCDLLMPKGHEYTDTEAWLDLLVNSEGDSIQVSIRDLMARYRWTMRHVRTFLAMLNANGQADIENVREGTIITLKRKKIQSQIPKNGTLNGTPFGTPIERKDNKIQEIAAHLLAHQTAHLNAKEIPLIPIEELKQVVQTGKDMEGKDLHPDEKAFAGFCMWIRNNAPYCSNPKNLRQLTFQEFLKLRFEYKYEGREIVECLMSLENDKEHRKKYSILYNTLINWLKLRHGDRR